MAITVTGTMFLPHKKTAKVHKVFDGDANQPVHTEGGYGGGFNSGMEFYLNGLQSVLVLENTERGLRYKVSGGSNHGIELSLVKKSTGETYQIPLHDTIDKTNPEKPIRESGFYYATIPDEKYSLRASVSGKGFVEASWSPQIPSTIEALTPSMRGERELVQV